MEKYKKSLEDASRERLAVVRWFEELEKKIYDLEKVNVALTKINEPLIDECTVEDGKLQSLNESFLRSKQDLENCKEALILKEQEVGEITTELGDLVDGEGNVRHNMREYYKGILWVSSWW